jgi:hypothetical protein
VGEPYRGEVAVREMGVGNYVHYFPDPTSVKKYGKGLPSATDYSCALSSDPSLMMLITTHKWCFIFGRSQVYFLA